MTDLKISYNKPTSDNTTDPVVTTAAVFTCKVNPLLLPTIVIFEIITTKLWVERSKNSFRFEKSLITNVSIWSASYLSHLHRTAILLQHQNRIRHMGLQKVLLQVN